ncbi:MAG: HAD hydrolase family protein [Deltaproteobacteria bacterium]|nr:HAD hydrolase family protein [Candidatus Anaeroferrophillacea bacterium]
MTELIIFTDLDGTLLDKETYSWESARPALDRCRELGVPVVAVTSKTLEETRDMAAGIGLDERFVFENGGGIWLGADRGVLVLGRPHAELRAAFRRLTGFFPDLRGMTDMTVAEVAAFTGLLPAAAELARRRRFSEPFVIVSGGGVAGPAVAAARAPEIVAAAAEMGLQVVRGGRFYHLMAAGQSKGVAVRRLTVEMIPPGAPAPQTAGLGDSPNDFPLLTAVDFPFLVRLADGGVTPCQLPGVTVATRPGPAGWCEVVLALLARPGS